MFKWNGWNRYTAAKLNSLLQDMEALKTEMTQLKAEIGDLDDLSTTAKTTLVAAINEAATSGTT